MTSACRMTSEMNEKAQEIIESIAKLPCARPFLNPVNPDDESTRLYYRKVKDPIDLSLITMRILLKKYQYVSEFQSDVQLILKNSRTFNGPTHLITQLAEILIKNFEKMFYSYFPMPVRMWTEKVNNLTWKIQNLFANAKMPKCIETEVIIGATVMQAIEQQDATIKQVLLSKKFSKSYNYKNIKSTSSDIRNEENTNNNAENFNCQNNSNIVNVDNYDFNKGNKNIKFAVNNNFIIPVIQTASASFLKTSNTKISSDEENLRPSFIPLPLEPVFIPFHSRTPTDSFVDPNDANSELISFYKDHFCDYGFKEETKNHRFDNTNSSYSNNRHYISKEEEEESSDDFFMQMDILPLDYLSNEQEVSSLEFNTFGYQNYYDGSTQYQEGNNIRGDDGFSEQIEYENNNLEQSNIQKAYIKGKDRRAAIHKSDETDDEWKFTENKRRGRPKKIKNPIEDKNQDKSNEKERSTEKDKNKNKEKIKDKSKDKIKEKSKSKTKTKTKNKNENDGKSKKSSKRLPKDTKDKKELKEIKESKGHKIPRKTALVRKTKSDSDFNINNHENNDSSSSSPPTTSKHLTKASDDHIEHDHAKSNEKTTIKKKKLTIKRQNRRNLSADDGTDDDFLPITKSTTSQNSATTNHKNKRKTKNTSKRHNKFSYDDDDDEYGADNDDEFDNDFEPIDIKEDTLTDGHLIAFMEAAHQLNGPNDQKEMAAIIHNYEPQISFIGAYPVIDITKLKSATLLALIKYTKKKFKERGKEYPIC